MLVPRALASNVYRQMAEYLDDLDKPVLRDWATATRQDVWSFRARSPQEQQGVMDMLVDGPMHLSDMAVALGVTVQALAGYIGPLNKRAKKGGWAPPVRKGDDGYELADVFKQSTSTTEE